MILQATIQITYLGSNLTKAVVHMHTYELYMRIRWRSKLLIVFFNIKLFNRENAYLERENKDNSFGRLKLYSDFEVDFS